MFVPNVSFMIQVIDIQSAWSVLSRQLASDER